MASVEKYAGLIIEAARSGNASLLADDINRFAYVVDGKPLSKTEKQDFLEKVKVHLRESDNKQYLEFVSLLQSRMTDPRPHTGGGT